MVKTLCFCCRRHGFDPWSGKFPMPRSAATKEKDGQVGGGGAQNIIRHGAAFTFCSLLSASCLECG